MTAVPNFVVTTTSARTESTVPTTLHHATPPTESKCGTVVTSEDDEDDYMEDMFVDPHGSFEHAGKEWGGPTRGGRLPEPTRFGDWERKGRCSDF